MAQSITSLKTNHPNNSLDRSDNHNFNTAIIYLLPILHLRKIPTLINFIKGIGLSRIFDMSLIQTKLRIL